MKKVSKCLWCGSKDLRLFAHRRDGMGVVECGNCGLVMNDKLPVDPGALYDEEYFNTQQSDFEKGYEGVHYLVSPAFLFWQNALIRETINSEDKKSFLEIGCATGNLLEILRDNQSSLELKGIDISTYAITAARRRGFDVEESVIEEYEQKNFDLIFSSETMEHLTDLKSFCSAVDSRLSSDGLFLFYVPSISLEDAHKDRDKYVRFNVNMEHTLHFTPEFFQKQFKKFFSGEVLIKEFKTSFGPSIVGAVSKGAPLTNIKRVFTALGTEKVPPDLTSQSQVDLAILALKFSQFDYAEKLLSTLTADGQMSKESEQLLRGLLHFHRGELRLSNQCLERYLAIVPDNSFALKLLIANEREISKSLLEEAEKQTARQQELESQIFRLTTENNDLKNSKLVGSAIRLRKYTGKALNSSRSSKKKLIDRTLRLFYLATPPPVRPSAKYVFRRQWRLKTTVISNQPFNGPLVSVIIPYYNRGITINETIESLKKQSFQNFETIIVNDGSTDEFSIQQLKKLDAGGLRLKILNQKNQGVAEARNTGIKTAKGKYIVCLDSDDMLEPTYLEKCLGLLETHPDTDVATTDMLMFGVANSIYKEGEYNAAHLLSNNMVTTAAMFKKEAWSKVGGYKSNIGYEDWEFWVNLAENGFWGRNIPEALFLYRTALSSRYVEDKMGHQSNMGSIALLHPRFEANIKRLKEKKAFNKRLISDKTAFLNLESETHYIKPRNKNPNILLAVPWMTFGGAEALIYNFCREIKDNFNISFVTLLKSENEWEYKFKEISPYIYHLANLFDDDHLYIEFLSNYLRTREIDVLHVIHNGDMFKLLPELRARHPDLKIVVTMFNDRVVFYPDSLKANQYVNRYVTDNQAVAKSFKKAVASNKVTVIPNGINCYTNFNPYTNKREKQRAELGLTDQDIALFYIGRLSEEKNPDVFVKTAKNLSAHNNLKFFIIGDGPMRPTVERSIKNSDKIEYLGYQSDIAKYLSAADIFVLPSAIEGFPISILEAMSMKVAVIASGVGAVPDVIKDGEDGIIVTPGSAKEIADAIIKLKDNPKLLAEFKERSRIEVEKKYSNIVLGDNYKKMYTDLLK